jgi:signal transduction histidine kinase
MPEESTVTILTVDDNDALRYTLSRSLREGGYKVIEARNGIDAIRLAEGNPDLITLDVNLPDMDGFEICRRIKANPQTSHIPILHISATFVDPQHRIKGLDGGADAYLAEPVDREELLATVGALLRLKRAEQEARLRAGEAEAARIALKKAHDEMELRVKQRTAELQQKTTEVQELSGRLLRLQDDERRRIARELHDSTGQMLVALQVNLAVLKSSAKGLNSKMEKIVADSNDIIDEVTRQIRTMSYLLHPPLLDETGLESALEWYVQGFSKRSHIAVELNFPKNFGRLSDELEIAIFRIVQESLTNIHRHSQSTTATVSLTAEAGFLNLRVRDQGKGLPRIGADNQGNFVPGVGVLGMQERVRQLGGTFMMCSEKDGTSVVAMFPLLATTTAPD